MAALERGPLTAAQLSDAMDCETKQVTCVMASAITHGAVLVDKTVSPYVFSLPGTGRSQQIDAAPASVPQEQPVRARRAPTKPPAAPRLIGTAIVEKLADPPAMTDGSPRFGVFSDGALVIESGVARIELDPAMTLQLLELARAVIA